MSDREKEMKKNIDFLLMFKRTRIDFNKMIKHFTQMIGKFSYVFFNVVNTNLEQILSYCIFYFFYFKKIISHAIKVRFMRGKII